MQIAHTHKKKKKTGTKTKQKVSFFRFVALSINITLSLLTWIKKPLTKLIIVGHHDRLTCMACLDVAQLDLSSSTVGVIREFPFFFFIMTGFGKARPAQLFSINTFLDSPYLCYFLFVDGLLQQQILEFVLPVLFVGFLYLIKWSVQDTDGFSPETISASYPGNDDTLNIFSFTDYVTAMQAERFCEGRDAFFWEEDQDDAYSISGIPFGGYNWQVPFVKCDSRLCTEDGEPAAPLCEYLALGLAPFSDDDEMGKDQAEAFRDYIYWRYPQLQNKSQVPFDNDFVLMFDSDADVEQYVTAETYGEPENTKLALAVVFDGTDNSANYTYKIRVNSTGFNSPEDSGRPGFPTTPPTDKQFEHFAKDDEDTCPLFDGTNTFGPYSTSCTGQYVYNGFLTTQV